MKSRAKALLATSASGTEPRRLAKPGVLAALTTAALLCLTTPAWALHTHRDGGVIANPGSPIGLAVDNSGGANDGDLYVTTASGPPNPVQHLDASGAFLNSIGPTAPSAGFETSWSAAVDGSAGPSSGDVYVADLGNFSGDGSGGVFKFEPDGTYLGSISASATAAGNFAAGAVAVEASSGDVYVADYANARVLVFEAGTDTLLRQFPVLSNPLGIAVGPTGNVYVLNFSRTAVYDTAGSPVDFGGPLGVGILDDQGAMGVAVDDVTGVVFLTNSSHVSEYSATGQQLSEIALPYQWGIASHGATNMAYVADNQGVTVRRLDPAILPDVAAEAATGVGATAARLNGNVDPDGSTATCEFRYDTDPAMTSPVSQPCAPAGEYSNPIAVSAELTGLQPGTVYYFRLRGTSPDGSNDSSRGEFVTGAGPPTIDATTTISDRESTEATIHGAVNPRRAATTYWVEYGTDQSYGSSSPHPPADLAATGTASEAVQVALRGLSPGRVYHYRLVAANSEGTTNGGDQTFRTFNTPVQGLPDGRAYELVSPVRKNGNRAEYGYAIATDDGRSILYTTFGDVGSGDLGYSNFSLSTQDSDGWETRKLLSQSERINFVNTPNGLLVSKDLNRVAFGGEAYAPGVLQSGIFTSEGGGPGKLISTPESSPYFEAPPPANYTLYYRPAGASADLSTIYFSYTGKLLPEDAGRVLLEGSVGSRSGFYRYRDGQLSAAGILPDGSLDPEGATPPNTFDANDTYDNYDAEAFKNQVSEDGTRAFFLSPDPRSGSVRPPELYVRDGERTLLVSRQADSAQQAPSGAAPMGGIQYRVPTSPQYVAASKNGRWAVFACTDALTDDAPINTEQKLYRFDVDSQALKYLKGMSGSAFIVSEDGQRVLARPQAGEVKLWNSGAVTTVISGAPGTEGILTGVREAAAGNVYVFATTITPADADDPGGHLKVYRYEVRSDSLGCLSCPDSGPVTTDSALSPSYAAPTYSVGLKGELRGDHEVSADGRRVFFDTGDRLSTRDINGVSDVYAWEDGHVYLISSGRSPEPSRVLDSSASGDDVFFITADGLDPRDTDGATDVYDARVGVEISTPTPSCSGDSCQSAPTSPVAPSLASANLGSGGNARARCARAKRQIRKKDRSRCVKRGHDKRHSKRSRRARGAAEGRAISMSGKGR